MNDGLSTRPFLEEYSCPLSAQQMEEICLIVDSCTHYTEEEREQMIRERELRWQAGLDRVSSKYAAVTVSFPYTNGSDQEIITRMSIMRIRGKERTYYIPDFNDEQFRAIPNGELEGYVVVDEAGNLDCVCKERPKREGDRVCLMNTFEEAMRFLLECKSKNNENYTHENEIDLDWAV